MDDTRLSSTGALDPARERNAAADPVASRIRFLRRESGTSLRALAARVSARLAAAPNAGDPSARSRAPGVSASYLSLIENGHKVPDAGIAIAIAESLGDDPALYAAWIAVRKRTDVATGLSAARTLNDTLARLATGETSALPRIAGRSREAPASAAARLRVPLIREGDDPGDALRPACGIEGWLRLDLARLPLRLRERIARPVAWRVRADAAHVASRFAQGGVALLVRDCLPLAPEEIHAVRLEGRIALRRVLWNGRQLLLLPARGRHDFVVLEAPGAEALRSLVLGLAWPVEP